MTKLVLWVAEDAIDRKNSTKAPMSNEMMWICSIHMSHLHGAMVDDMGLWMVSELAGALQDHMLDT
jgi:hypothetical protein